MGVAGGFSPPFSPPPPKNKKKDYFGWDDSEVAISKRMGKNWRGGKGGRGGGRGGGGHGGSTHNLASVREHAFIMGTCDAARERETSKEVVNLLTQAIEKMGDDSERVIESCGGEATPSVQSLLAQELEEIRDRSNTESQSVMSIQTNTKGLVLIKLMRPDLCPVKLLKAIFRRVRTERLPCSRHVVRLIPLQFGFFPSEEELSRNIELIVNRIFPDFSPEKSSPEAPAVIGEKRKLSDDVAVDESANIKLSKVSDTDVDKFTEIKVDEGVVADSECGGEGALVPSDAGGGELPSACLHDGVNASDSLEVVLDSGGAATDTGKEIIATEEAEKPSKSSGRFFYSVSFKARNHNTLSKAFAYAEVKKKLPPFARYSNDSTQGIFIVEALCNIGGISYVTNYKKYEEFNLRKYQQRYCEVTASSSMLTTAGKEAAVTASDEIDEVSSEIPNGP